MARRRTGDTVCAVPANCTSRSSAPANSLPLATSLVSHASQGPSSLSADAIDRHSSGHSIILWSPSMRSQCALCFISQSLLHPSVRHHPRKTWNGKEHWSELVILGADTGCPPSLNSLKFTCGVNREIERGRGRDTAREVKLGGCDWASPTWSARRLIPAEPAEWHAASEEGDRQRGKPQGGKTGRGESSIRSETEKRMLH